MLVVEQLSSYFSGLSHTPASLAKSSDYHVPPRRTSTTSRERPLSPTTTTSITDGELDMELDDLNIELGPSTFGSADSSHSHLGDPRLMTFGLVLHSLADGLALGASLSGQKEEKNGSGLSGLSAVVFLALALHKGSFALNVFLSNAKGVLFDSDYLSPQYSPGSLSSNQYPDHAPPTTSRSGTPSHFFFGCPTQCDSDVCYTKWIQRNRKCREMDRRSPSIFRTWIQA